MTRDGRWTRWAARARRDPDPAPADAAAMHRILAENALDLITRHAPDGRIAYANPAARALLGRAPEALLGLTPAALVHPGDLAAVQAAFRDASYFGRDGGVQARLRRQDGRIVWAEMRLHRTEIGSDGGGDIVAVTRDITGIRAQAQALKEARDAAEAASRAKTAFLANMSHELRTPLNAIIGFSEIMAREMFGPLGAERYREYAGLIQDSGHHLLDLINTVLDMSKVEAGKFTLHEETFALEAVAQGAVQVAGVAAARAGVALELTGTARTVFADRRAVRQMLVNLLSNAVKFTPPGGRVSLTARTDGAALLLEVSDTGIGIAPADLARLGAPFEQVESAQGGGREGTGLGLALVKAMAALHGGSVTLASSVGEGTSVTVRLPHAALDRDPKVVPFRGVA